jgi:hypothetical protein
MNDLKRAFQYQKQAAWVVDSIGGAYADSELSLQQIRLNFYKSRDSSDYAKEKDNLKLRIETVEEKSRFRTLAFIAILAMAFTILGFLYYNNRQKQKTNAILSDQKAELEKNINPTQINPVKIDPF